MDWRRWIKLYPFALLVLLAYLPVFMLASHAQRRLHISPSQVEVDIGGCSGEDMAMQAIAEEIKTRPQIRTIIVCYSCSWLAWFGPEDDMDNGRLKYDRKFHALQYSSGDGTPSGPCTNGPWDGVSDEIINRVAETHGGSDDVKKFGARWGGI